MTTTLARRRIIAVAALVVASAPLAAPAFANDDDVVRTGSCTGSTDWKLKASPENRRIEVEGEVDSNRAGQTWNWRIVHNGSVAARGTGVTGSRSGSFEARRVLSNGAGRDSFVFRARNEATGEICRGTLTF